MPRSGRLAGITALRAIREQQRRADNSELPFSKPSIKKLAQDISSNHKADLRFVWGKPETSPNKA